MNSDQLIAIFDRQAPGYDRQGGARRAIEAALHAALPAVFREVPDAARILCVGMGAGQDVGVIPMSALAKLVEAAGFEAPLAFFQAGLIRAWCARAR